MFSEKYGYKAVQAIQIGGISDKLRTRIWNLFYHAEIQAGGLSSPRIQSAFKGEPTIEEKIADKLGFLAGSSNGTISTIDRIKEYLTIGCCWYEVYDFVEIHLSCLLEDAKKERAKQYNELFVDEKSGYRVVSYEIVQITNPIELETIETASLTPYDAVKQHIHKAIEKYGDLQAPDYENSVKESISAVEAMCCIITGLSGKQATLGNAIKKLKDASVHIHPAMERGFDALYGYTSDENGIRHGGINFQSVPEEDAKYMLITCSAFINYLVEKWSKIQTKENMEKLNGE